MVRAGRTSFERCKVRKTSLLDRGFAPYFSFFISVPFRSIFMVFVCLLARDGSLLFWCSGNRRG